jgi:uncharacterized membrane protein YhaH (DUF805 family)
MCCQSTQLVQKRSIDISCAEVGLFFFSSILWPSCAVSVRRWNQITCSLASSVLLVAVVAVEGGDVCCFFCLVVLAEVIACHLRQLVHEASADITCG